MSGARRYASMLVSAVLLVGCTILPDSPPRAVYRLPESTVTSGSGDPVAVALRVARPSASGVLRSARIAVVPDDNLLSVYEGVRWNAPVPELWRDQLIDAFHNDGRIERLSSDNAALQADRELGGTLRAFQTEYPGGEPQVVIRLDAQLIDPATRRIVASRRFTATQPISGGQVPDVVAAFGRASDTLARELVDWTVERVQPGD